MQKSWSTALKASISEVFSTSFFMVPETYPDPVETVHGTSAAGWYEGYLDYARNDGGVRIWVWTPGQIAQDLAANIFACDPAELDQSQILDAFREMINMVSGNVLTNIDADSSWKMGLPKAGKIGQGTVGQAVALAQEQLVFDVDGQPVLAGWRAFKA